LIQHQLNIIDFIDGMDLDEKRREGHFRTRLVVQGVPRTSITRPREMMEIAFMEEEEGRIEPMKM
jgi:hypothetical protein